jgi:MarR family transcriptional regulator for hemolysin
MTDSSDPKSAFGYTVGDITRLLRRVFDRRAASLGLTRAQWRALSRIQRCQGVTQADLAEQLELQPIAIGRVIDRLVQAGFVERRADPDDRRCWRLHLSDRSTEVMGKMRRIAADLREDVLAGIDDEELARLMRSLNTIKATLCELDKEVRPRAPARKNKP